LYWAQAIAEQDDDQELKGRFSALAQQLADNEMAIIEELNVAQGAPVDIGGYYYPAEELANTAMRPSKVLNRLIDEFSA
jgi:isocitrate dehydrogenase